LAAIQAQSVPFDRGERIIAPAIGAKRVDERIVPGPATATILFEIFRDSMDLQKAEQAIINGIYAGVAWLILDVGLLFQEHGGNIISFLISQPKMILGAVIVIACIVGMFYKSRLAAVSLFLLFLIPLLLRGSSGVVPSSMVLLFFCVILYFFLAAVIGAFSYHQLKKPEQNKKQPN
jgi:hypothetical protein